MACSLSQAGGKGRQGLPVEQSLGARRGLGQTIHFSGNQLGRNSSSFKGRYVPDSIICMDFQPRLLCRRLDGLEASIVRAAIDALYRW